MGPDFGIGQTEYTPLPLLPTAVYNCISRVLTTETALPTNVLAVHRIMITNFASSLRWERPALVKKGDIEVCFQSIAVGKLGHGFEEIPTEVPVYVC